LNIIESMKVSRALILSCIFLLVPAAARAEADDKHADAKVHYDKGTTLYDLGQYKEAAREFEEAFKIVSDPALLFNIGQAYRLGNEPASALRAYRGFLRRFPNAKNRAVIENHIAALQKLVEEQKRVATSPPTETIPPGTQPRESVPPVPVAPQSAVVAAAPLPPPATPVYKKWWLWTIVGVAAAGVGVGLGVGLTAQHGVAIPSGAYTLNFH
jgi:tetratricopeptide (TPR) repeat protein